MTADKAVASALTSILVLVAMFMGWGTDVVATWSGIIAALCTAIAPFLVYLVPNRAKA
jgi:hypothetical protein